MIFLILYFDYCYGTIKLYCILIIKYKCSTKSLFLFPLELPFAFHWVFCWHSIGLSIGDSIGPNFTSLTPGTSLTCRHLFCMSFTLYPYPRIYLAEVGIGIHLSTHGKLLLLICRKYLEVPFFYLFFQESLHLAPMLKLKTINQPYKLLAMMNNIF